MHKKIYVSPELTTVRLTLRDIVLASPEDISSQIGGNGDWGDPPPPIDPDDDIIW